MIKQRIMVTTIDREAADHIYRVMNAVSWIDCAHMPSFTDYGDSFTVQHEIPCEVGNYPLMQVWQMIGRYLDSVTAYSSVPA